MAGRINASGSTRPERIATSPEHDCCRVFSCQNSALAPSNRNEAVMTAKKTGGDGPAKSTALVKPKGKPRGREGGRKPTPFTEDDRDTVTRLAAVGTRQEVIARILKISVDTLQRRFRAELDCGLDEANAQVAGALFSKALAGDTSSMIWWEKTRAGMRETFRQEMTGRDGGPIEIAKLTDEEVDARIAALLESGGARPAAD